MNVRKNWENGEIINGSILKEKGVNVLIPKSQYNNINILTDTIILGQVNIAQDVWLLNMY